MYSDDELDEFAKVYERHRPVCDSYRIELDNLVRRILEEEKIKFQIVTSRAKEISSYRKKCSKADDDGRLKYSNPIKQIEDLSGVRVICFTLSDRKKIVQTLVDRLDVAESNDVGEVRFQQGKFGYQSHHLIAELGADLLTFPGYKKFENLKCEIQVRTVLQHAWAEIEHDIRYKSERDLPDQTKRNFIALAGLLEIADKEFERIQKEDDAYKENVSESIDDIIQSATLQTPVASGKTEKVTQVTIASQPVKVRELLESGNFDEAIERYTELIEAEPKSYNLYLGRAKAYFLLGDRTKALADIDDSESIRGKDPEVFDAIRNKMNSMETVDKVPKLFQSGSLEKAQEALISGDPVKAFEFYSNAQDEGYSRPYSNFNKAMSCCLGRDYDGTNFYLNKLEFRPGTFVSVNMAGLRWINSILAGSELVAVHEKAYHDAIAGLSEFDSNLSPLRKLEKGFSAIKDGRFQLVKPAFKTVNQ